MIRDLKGATLKGEVDVSATMMGSLHQQLVMITSKDFGEEGRRDLEILTGSQLRLVALDDKWAVYKCWLLRQSSQSLIAFLEEQEAIHEWFSWRIL